MACAPARRAVIGTCRRCESAYLSAAGSLGCRWDSTNGTVNQGTFDEGQNSDSFAYGVSI
jgi:hypothetical protein